MVCAGLIRGAVVAVLDCATDGKEVEVAVLEVVARVCEEVRLAVADCKEDAEVIDAVVVEGCDEAEAGMEEVDAGFEMTEAERVVNVDESEDVREP